MQHSADRPERGTKRHGFTLIELLVVVSIITLLMSILIPSMRKARDHAKEVACGSLMRGLGNGLANYFYENSDWIPGMNTSGAGLRSKRMIAQAEPESYKNKRMPVQAHDWLSPIIDEPNLPDKRAERFAFLLEQYRCPAVGDLNSIAYGLDEAPDFDDLKEIRRWNSISYLMPVHFQFWGQNQKNRTLTSMEDFSMVPVKAKAAPDTWEVLAKDFKSKLQQVGNAGTKVFIADGTRFLTSPEEGVLDHDVSLFPNLFGSFTSTGAWWRGSTAYGVHPESESWGESPNTGEGSHSKGQNLRLSYRHSSHDRFDGHAKNNFGLINALFFDGHVTLMNDENSRDIDSWYPKGAVVQTPSEGMTDAEADQVIR